MHHEKRKLPRFHISHCQFLDTEEIKTFPVQDVSRGGLAIRLMERADLPKFAVSSIHEGMIKVEGRKLPCSFQVRNIRGTLIGAEWVDPGAALVSLLEEISHPGRLGVNLRKFDLPEVNATHWFHNPVGVDLLFYQAGRWMLYIHQNFIQWESDSGVQTGQALAEADEGYTHGIVRLETRLIEYDPMIDRSLVRAAKDLVEHAPIDNPELKTLVLTHLSGVS
ncbi:MAG: PilZ domain-containing protein [Bdellovibrionales bacterium]|nr:PilZ domain-containing protein [Bdellovibrionales bacterium]